ncbi:glycosyltransferase [Bacillus sp. ISL-35]|uniref:glycosyltransferase n=1 Tax=Bacillus sp. ISL-35 TaxID=2819122 RepID=UPI001BE58FCE|nr:glycosyltransferase [Bacillus sp. ISL-35]MBT2678863.1 glycosyltransferase [Bacillus sp. ISL-35]MBT2703855.1 glycosyltransferase [Chryseobacterium sp. ISL-80]
MKPFLSVCLIVKDEEKVLSRCLESVNGIADEIIIADTGSVDRTKEIALKYTDMVYDYKWDEDFSKARNFAASRASGEWIFVIDADEYVDRDSFLKFKTNLKENPVDSNILAVQIVNFVGANGKDTVLNYHERIYLNNGIIFYYRPIHEMLKHKEAHEKRGFAQLQIFHSGYMENVIKEKQKSKRNLSLLIKKKVKEPIDYYFLGNEYYQIGNLEKAINYYKKGYQLKENINIDWVKKLLVRLVNCLHIANRDTEAMEIIDASEEVFENLVDFKFLKGKILFNQGKIKETINIFEDILLKKNKLIADSSMDYLEYLPHRYLGELYEKENNLHLAVHHYSKTISINESDDLVWVKLINLLAKHSTMDELTNFINNNCLKRNTMNPLRLIKILLMIPNKHVQKLTRSLISKTPLAIEVEKALILKNLFLDDNKDDILEFFITNNIEEISLILSQGIFQVVDLILIALETKDDLYKNILFGLKFSEPINNLLNLLFLEKTNDLSSFEEELLSLIIKNAEIHGKHELFAS